MVRKAGISKFLMVVFIIPPQKLNKLKFLGGYSPPAPLIPIPDVIVAIYYY